MAIFGKYFGDRTVRFADEVGIKKIKVEIKDEVSVFGLHNWELQKAY